MKPMVCLGEVGELVVLRAGTIRPGIGLSRGCSGNRWSRSRWHPSPPRRRGGTKLVPADVQAPDLTCGVSPELMISFSAAQAQGGPDEFPVERAGGVPRGRRDGRLRDRYRVVVRRRSAPHGV